MGVLNDWEKVATDAELSELKKSVSDGKKSVAEAITDKGIITATDAVFATMADNIGQISTLATETADATATAAQILSGKRAYVKGSPVVGTMPNNGGVSAAISNGSLKAGYTTGGDIANLAAGNVKKGVNIGGIVGGLIDWSPLNIKQLRTNINAVGTIVATAPGKLIGFYIYLASNTSESEYTYDDYHVQCIIDLAYALGRYTYASLFNYLGKATPTSGTTGFIKATWRLSGNSMVVTTPDKVDGYAVHASGYVILYYV